METTSQKLKLKRTLKLVSMLMMMILVLGWTTTLTAQENKTTHQPQPQKTKSADRACGEAKVCVKRETAAQCKAQAQGWDKLLKESKDSRADQYRCEGKLDTMGGWVDRYRNERDEWRDAANHYKRDAQKNSLDLERSKEREESYKNQRFWYALGGAGATVVGVIVLRLLLGGGSS